MKIKKFILLFTINLLIILNLLYTPFIKSNNLPSFYHSYDEVVELLHNYALNYPELVKLNNLGKTYENRDIISIIISSNSMKEKQKVLYLGGTHANEYMGTEISIKLIEYLLKEKDNNEIKNILDKNEIWIIPMRNPDGSVYAQNYDKYWRNNRQPNPDGSIGIDLNRNFGPFWVNETWFGEKPFIAKENEIIHNLILSTPFSYIIDFHSCRESISGPNTELHKAIITKMCYGYNYNDKFYNGNGYRPWYSKVTNIFDYINYNGSMSMNLWIERGGINIWFELNTVYEGKLPTENIIYYTWEKNINAILYPLRFSDKEIGIIKGYIKNNEGASIDSDFYILSRTNNMPKYLKYFKNKTYNGFYYWILEPGNYDLIISKPGYKVNRISFEIKGGEILNYENKLEKNEIFLPIPKNLSYEINSKKIKIKWDPIRNENIGFNIYRGYSSNNYILYPLNENPITENSYTDDILKPGIDYFYLVKSVNLNNIFEESDYSEELYIKVQEKTKPIIWSSIFENSIVTDEGVICVQGFDERQSILPRSLYVSIDNNLVCKGTDDYLSIFTYPIKNLNKGEHYLECEVSDNNGNKTYIKNKFNVIDKNYNYITTALLYSPNYLNPLFEENLLKLQLSRLWLPGLTKINNLGLYEPELLEEIPSFENGKILKEKEYYNVYYKLRDNLSWSDGKPITSKDVLFTYNTILKNGSSGLKDKYLNIESIEILNDSTFIIKFKHLYADFLSLFNFILPEHILKNEVDLKNSNYSFIPYCISGPFLIDQFAPNKQLVLKRNKKYWNGSSKIENLIIKFYNENQIDNLMIEVYNGNIDYVCSLYSYYYFSTINYGLESLNTSLKFDNQINGVKYIILNTSSNLLKEKKLREAIHLSLNKLAFADHYELSANSIIPKKISLDKTLYDSYNPTKSKEILLSLGWKDINNDNFLEKGGISLNLNLITSNAGRAEWNIIENLNNIGVAINIENLNHQEFIKRLNEGKFDLAIYNIDYNDPNYTFIKEILSSNGKLNYSNYKNLSMDTLIEEFLSCVDLSKRIDKYNKIENLIIKDIPIIPYAYYYNVNLYNKKLLNLKSNIYGLYWNAENWLWLPSKIENFKIEEKENSIHISWSNPKNGTYPISGYVIYKKIGEGDWFLLTNLDKNTFEYIDSDIIPSQNYSYYIISYDSQYNFSEKSEIFSIKLKDKNPPNLEIIFPQTNNYLTNNSNITISGRTFDNESGIKNLTINNIEISITSQGDFNYNVNLTEGENNFLIISKDKENNETSKNIKIICDLTPPQINLLLPSETSEPTVLISGTITDNLSGVKYLKINNINIPISSNNKFSYSLNLNEGVNNIIFESEDNAGNKISKESKIIRIIKRTIMILQINNKIMYINNNPVNMEVSPQIIHGRTYLPIRYILEPLGANLLWDPNEKKVTIILNDIKIELWIGKNLSKVNNNYKLIDPDNPKVTPLIINGRTMLPIRFVAENLGCKVDWDKENQIIKIEYLKL